MSTTDTSGVGVAALGERLAPLRLRGPESLRAMQHSMLRHGQLTAVTAFADASGALQLVDGFKRLHVARELGWTELRAYMLALTDAQAKVALHTLNKQAGLCELEEAWLVRSLYRDDGLTQPQIGQLLGRHKSWVCRRLMLVELLDEVLQGDVRLRPKSRPEPSRPTTVHGPAEMAENDWSPHTIKFTHAPAAVVQVFAYVLIYSTRKHFALYERSDLHALMEGHVETFEHFGGAAHKCKYDSQKAVVLGWEGNQPIYNPRFLSFSVHYDMRPVACRRFKPNDKPRVERAFWEFERSFLNGRSFRDLEDMRAQLRWWQDNVAIRGLGDGARNGRGWSSSPRSSPCCGRCRGTAMTPRGSSIDCAASMATCRGTATVTRCPTSTSPTSCRCGSRHGSCSCTPPICAAWPATSSRRAAPVRTWGASDTTHGGRESEAPTSTSCG